MSKRILITVACALALPLFAATPRKGTAKGHEKVWNDATRLAAILSDVQNQRVTFTGDAWRVTANEANVLANRIYAGAGGRAPAKDLRMHVRQLREAALKGDASGARSQASEALPFAYQVIDWSMPQ